MCVSRVKTATHHNPYIFTARGAQIRAFDRKPAGAAFAMFRRGKMRGQVMASFVSEWHMENCGNIRSTLRHTCAVLQADVLTPRGVTHTLNMDIGELSEEKCFLLGCILREMVLEIWRHDVLSASGGHIAVTLHHTGQIWVLAVEDVGIRRFDCRMPVSRISAVQGMAAPLAGTCRTRLLPDGAVTVVLFTVAPSWRGALSAPVVHARMSDSARTIM
jgi:hypothetical protein